MRFKRTLTRILGVALVSTLGACGGSSGTSDSSGTAASDCSVAGQNAQILATMRSWYYWYTSLPANVDTAAYASADALLNALRQQPLDRFTYFTSKTADQAFYGAGQYVGFGLRFGLTSANNLRVNQVFPGSPADAADLLRGDTVTALNGTPVPTLVATNQLGSVLSVSSVGVTVKFTYVDAESQSHTRDLTSAVVTDPSVGLATTLDAGRRKVGYILFDSFIDTSNAALDQAFTRFGSEGVTELVIDERYNGGGEVSVAQHLASLIAGNSYSGKTLATLTFNDKHPDQNQTISFETVSHPLNLTRVFFITTDATASASELTINALTPYIRVVTVGRATFGKPVGENGFDVCTNVLYPITFKIANARGYGDYFDGLPATCPAVDDTGHPLGDPAEASLATAIGYVQGHGCGAAATSADVAQALAEAEAGRAARTSRYGWRQLVNAY
jgi:carboxyl-terminal processing protease